MVKALTNLAAWSGTITHLPVSLYFEAVKRQGESRKWGPCFWAVLHQLLVPLFSLFFPLPLLCKPGFHVPEAGLELAL